MRSVDLSPSFRFRSRLARILPERLYARLDQADHSHRVYILPSAVGLYFSMISLILFLIAISYGHNLAYFSTFLFFSFVSLSAVVANENTCAFSVNWSHESIRGRVDSSIPTKLVVKNLSNKKRYDISIEVTGIIVGSIAELEKNSQCEVVVDLGLLGLSRGSYEINRFAISTRFPFGLFYAWSWKKDPIRLIVHPAAKQGHYQERRFPSMLDGQGAMAFHQGSSEFFETRPHRSGESMARIDRRLSQRLGFPQIREFRDEASVTQVLDLVKGEVEENLQLAVNWLDNAPDENHFGIVYPNGIESDFGQGELHRQLLLDELACFEKPPVRLS